MKFLEKDLEDIIFETDNDLLQEHDLFISGKKIRQFRIGNYGIADLVTFRKDTYDRGFLHIEIYELKQDEINVGAFLQALGYKRGIDSYLKQRGVKFDYKITINLIGKSVCKKSCFTYITDCFDDIYIYTYSYNFEGLFFNSVENYRLIYEGFKFPNKIK